ncbi:MAG: DUF2975 domain-containing protein [Myxococcales bacterium]|nr:DUF2975 domain-containing protein [Myxococcales bacterium]
MTDTTSQAPGLPPKFRRWSRVGSVCCWLVGAALLLGTLATRIKTRAGLAREFGFHTGAYIESWQELSTLVLMLTPGVLLTLALFQLAKALSAFARGEYFQESTVARLRRFSGLMLASALAGLVLPSVCSLLLSYGVPPGEGRFSVGIGSGQVLGVLCAGGTWLFAALLAETRRLSQENSEFV